MRRLASLLLFGCATASPAAPPTSPNPRPDDAARSGAERPPSFSPQPQVGTPLVTLPCPTLDAALTRAAEGLAQNLQRGGGALDAQRVQQALREQGAPYVWPRAWTLAGLNIREQLPDKLQGWLASYSGAGQRRCGVAVQELGGGRQIAVAIAVDALADLEPVPAQVRVGTWVDVGATLLVPSSEAKVVVLGPSGPPRSVPTSASGGRVRARFAADREGLWKLQVLAAVGGGPRPVLEAEFAAGELSLSTPESAENAATGADPADLLNQLLNAARRREGLPALASNTQLTRVAQEYAERLRAAGHIAHDLGDGDPEQRVTEAGIRFALVGENVAHADDAGRAHRALWNSPSHRANILNERFDSIGIGVAADERSIWVCQLFARLSN